MKRPMRRELQRRLPMLHMSEDLRTMLGVVKGPELDLLGEMLLHFDGQMKLASKHPDKAGVAAGLHDAMDRTVQDTLARHPRAGEVKCRAGCDHCCHFNVDITASEAELLVRFVRLEGIEIDRERLQKQAGKGVHERRELTREERACVFLKDGKCAVYEHRPGACRKLNVVTDPKWCDAVTYPGHDVGRLAAPEAEVIWSVMMTHEKRGHMADMLLEAMDGKATA